MSKLDEPMEVEVLVRQTLTKEETVYVSSIHPEYESDYDPTTGRREAIVEWVPDNVVEEAQGQYTGAYECLRDCAKVLPVLLKEVNSYRKLLGIPPMRDAEKVDIYNLAFECQGWELEEEKILEQ